MTSLVLDDVGVRYGSHTAVHGFSDTVRPGDRRGAGSDLGAGEGEGVRSARYAKKFQKNAENAVEIMRFPFWLFNPQTSQEYFKPLSPGSNAKMTWALGT